MYLPPELYRPIVQNVDRRKDLHRLLFVSRAVSSEAERVLYHTIRRTGANPTRSMQLFDRLACCWRIARHVRELEVSGAIDHQLMEALGRALRALKNLHTLSLLELYIQHGHPKHRCYNQHHPHADVISGCTFKLEVIKLPNRTAKGLSGMDLTQVKELFLDGPDDCGIEFPKEAFSMLRVLSCRPSEFLKLGSHHVQQLKALELKKPLPCPDETFPSVTSLKAYTTDGIMSFPSLRFLCIKVDSSYLKSKTALSGIVGELSVLKHLEKLCLVTFNYPHYHPAGLSYEFFSRLGSLKELIISPNLRGNKQGTRWDRVDQGKTDRGKIVLADIESEWKSSCWF